MPLFRSSDFRCVQVCSILSIPRYRVLLAYCTLFGYSRKTARPPVQVEEGYVASARDRVLRSLSASWHRLLGARQHPTDDCHRGARSWLSRCASRLSVPQLLCCGWCGSSKASQSKVHPIHDAAAPPQADDSGACAITGGAMVGCMTQVPKQPVVQLTATNLRTGADGTCSQVRYFAGRELSGQYVL